jgi:hypothetical protein
MKKVNLAFAMLFAALYALGAETAADILVNKAELSIMVDGIAPANRDVLDIVGKYSLVVEENRLDNTAKTAEFVLYATSSNFADVLAGFESLGIVYSKELSVENYTKKNAEMEYDLQYLREQKKIYRDELQKMRSDSESYDDLFARERELDSSIYDKEKEKMDLAGLAAYSVINLSLMEKSVQDLDSDDGFSGFINMPGAETKFFHLENPDGSVMSDDYLGGSLRYMFTRGRAYFLIGILKPLGEDSPADTMVDDIVIYGFGKDFYPRYFGQGRNRFFNFYSGFEFGGMVMTSPDDIAHVFTMEPHLGVELFKNKYVILDVRAGYLFPLEESMIKTHRGFTQNISFNFVF